MRFFYTILLFLLSNIFYCQDTTYARLVIKKLCSKELLGRGYVNNGVNKAASFISKELKSIGVCKFGQSYAQNYEFPVNTFPANMSVLLDGKPLIAGKHYLIEPSTKSVKMKLQLICSFMIERDIYILDEPFSGFDPINANMLKDEILGLKERGTSILFSTHQFECHMDIFFYPIECHGFILKPPAFNNFFALS